MNSSPHLSPHCILGSGPLNPGLAFCGPFLGKIIFILVGGDSKWLKAEVVSSTSSQQTIRVLRPLCGLPEVLVFDSGTAFTSAEFQTIVKCNGSRHIRSVPITQPLMDWLNEQCKL